MKKILLGIFAVLFAIFLIMFSEVQSLAVIVACYALGVIGVVLVLAAACEKE